MSTREQERICIGVDVGGTFTDAVLTDGSRTWRAKSSTTPGRLGDGVLAAVELAARRSGRTLDQLMPEVARFGLGTTAVTNALAARSGRKVGLLTTRGFESMLPLARGTRVVDDAGWLALPPQIIEPRCIVGIDERVDRHGAVLTPLDPSAVLEETTRLVKHEGVEAIAVSYLWSFLNPAHEIATLEAISSAYPDLTTVAGSNLLPAIREYERTTYTVLNAYVSGALGGIEQLESDLHDLGLSVPLLLVHSAGGSTTVAEARRQPLGLAASGPAAGVAAAVTVAGASGYRDLITCDMGGTSFDVSVVEKAQPARRTRGELMGVWTALPLIDVESIGAGGGSIGWVDARRMLRVGPRSAGAVPGPASYGRGGTDATVTDALVVLGYIDPGRFLGGEFDLDAAAATAACTRLGEPLQMGPDETAWGIREISLAGMVKATRARVAALGVDPRQFSIVSFGGSGSLFTADIARALGITRVVVPELASVLSAFGTATADVRRERVRPVLATMPVDPVVVRKLMEELSGMVIDDLAADGVAPDDRSVHFEADLRFSKQIYELQLPLRADQADEAVMESIVEDFHDEYARRYGKGSIVLGAPVEIVNLRAVGIGKTVSATLSAAEAAVPAGTAAPPASTRSVRMGRGTGESQEVAVHRGDQLRPGHHLEGPALVDGSDTTVWVPAGSSAAVDANGSLVIEVNQ